MIKVFSASPSIVSRALVRLVLSGLLVAVVGSNAAHGAVRVVNNSNRKVFVAVRYFAEGHSEPDYVSPARHIEGWYIIAPGGVHNFGSDAELYIRMTYDSVNGPLIVPAHPVGNPMTQLVHPTKKFLISWDPESKGDPVWLAADGDHLGDGRPVSFNDAVNRHGCKVLSGFYNHGQESTFTIGGNHPPAGTVRTESWSFEYRAGATERNKPYQAMFPSPPGTTITKWSRTERSSRRANPSWSLSDNHKTLTLNLSVSGDGNLFGGAGGAYVGDVIIYYRYD